MGDGALTLTATDLVRLVGEWAWPFVRVAALVAVAPVFGHRAVPARVRIGLALALTVVIAPVVPPPPAVEPFGGVGMLITASELLVGLALGFTLRLLFVALEVMGQQVAQLMGLGFASLVDPQNGVEVPVVSQLYLVLATLAFVTLDAHLVLIELLASSFVTLPVGTGGLARDALFVLVGQLDWVLAAAVALALPAVVALLTVNLCFGVMTKTAPQLNIFVVGFPVTLLFGFVVILLTLPASLGELAHLVERALGAAGTVIGAAPGGAP